MKKHAYLIMAHNNFFVLEKLLTLLDDERNDIYIHLDKKVENFDFEYYKSIVKSSNVFFSKRINVYWGDYSQIEAEYILMKYAYKREYAYYHLLSGVDLPIKTQDYIHLFFNENDGKNYIQFVCDEYKDKVNARCRLSRYKFFQKYVRDKNVVKKSLANLFQNIAMPIQSALKVDRLKKEQIEIGYGANWFSLTNNAIKLIVEKEYFIKKHFIHTLCADELFVQTILLNFSNEIISNDLDFNGNSHLRLIDWKRGNPYIFKKEDFEMIMKSECLFARKFDEKVDRDIVILINKFIELN